jgi:hypothetical protein
MDCGLGSLIALKRGVLPETLLAHTTFDQLLQSVGVGVANAFGHHCGRRFPRMVGDVYEFAANLDLVTLPRYPVEGVTKVELRARYGEAWTEQTGVIDNLAQTAGLLFLIGPLSDSRGLVRVTFTGGYWFDDSEDGTGVMPEGATALPETIRTAWIIQTKKIMEDLCPLWRQSVAAALPNQIADPSVEEFTPIVREMLRPFRRF